MRVVVFNIYFYVSTFVLALTAWAVSFLSVRAVCGIAHFWTKVVRFGVSWILGARIEIRGQAHLPTDGLPALIIPKHQSELDAITALYLFPNLTAVAMAQLADYIFFGRILKALDLILVRVDGPRQNMTQAVVEGALGAQAQGRPILIYPEGELMRLGAQERYRAGAWHIYNALGVPAYPVAMSLGVIWPRRAWAKTPKATGAYEFLEPIEPGLDKESFLTRLEEQIETATMALIEEHAAPEVAARARALKARGADNEGIPSSQA